MIAVERVDILEEGSTINLDNVIRSNVCRLIVRILSLYIYLDRESICATWHADVAFRRYSYARRYIEKRERRLCVFASALHDGMCFRIIFFYEKRKLQSRNMDMWQGAPSVRIYIQSDVSQFIYVKVARFKEARKWPNSWQFLSAQVTDRLPRDCVWIAPWCKTSSHLLVKQQVLPRDQTVTIMYDKIKRYVSIL